MHLARSGIFDIYHLTVNSRYQGTCCSIWLVCIPLVTVSVFIAFSDLHIASHQTPKDIAELAKELRLLPSEVCDLCLCKRMLYFSLCSFPFLYSLPAVSCILCGLSLCFRLMLVNAHWCLCLDHVSGKFLW